MATEEREAGGLRPGDIEGRRFTIGKRGYQPEEVHGFLRAVADQMGRLQGEIDWQRARVEHLEQRSLAAQDSAYERISREFMEVVRRADEAATQVRSRAEHEARAAFGDAREDADRMVSQAAEDAERIVATARMEAERLVAEATGRVERAVHVEDPTPRSPWLPSERDLEMADVPHAGNGHSAPFDYFAASEQVTVTPNTGLARSEGSGNGTSTGSASAQHHLPDPPFADFEHFDLQFDGSVFDLFGDAGP